MDREGVYRHREVLRVDLGELLAAGVVFEEGVEHLVGDLLGAGPVDLVDLLGVGVVGVKAPELVYILSFSSYLEHFYCTST